MDFFLVWTAGETGNFLHAPFVFWVIFKIEDWFQVDISMIPASGGNSISAEKGRPIQDVGSAWISPEFPMFSPP